MKIHTVFITYNRLELTKRAIASYLETVTVPWTLWVVDNNSTDGTREWLLEESGSQDWPLGSGLSLLSENRYPGFACNFGFEKAPSDATYLHRADNDFAFLAGWCDVVQERFQRSRKLGQLGLRTGQEERSTINVGGNCIFLRKVWNRGLRYDERPWPQIRDEVGPGWTEDSLMGSAVRDLGYYWARVRKPCIEPIGVEAEDDPYYQATWADRGIK